MRWQLTLAFLSGCFGAQAQFDSLLYRQALQQLSQGRYLDAAIMFERGAGQISNDRRHSIWLEMAGHCYSVAARKGIDPKLNYWRAVHASPYDASYQNRHDAMKLARLYFAERKYDSALTLLKFVAAKPSIRNLCCSNSIEMRTEFAHTMLLAYEGLKETDSALRVFAPYAFQAVTSRFGAFYAHCHEYEGDYHRLLLDFVRVLEKKYGIEAVAAECRALPQHWNTLVRREKDRGIFWVEREVLFFDAPIRLAGIYGVSAHDSYVDKESNLQRANLLLFWMFTSEP